MSWGTRAFYSETSCDFFFSFFFSIQPTNPISGNTCNAKWKKGGWPYTKKFFKLVAFLLYSTVSLSQRSYESLFQHVKHCMTIFLSMKSALCAILPQTQIPMYANLVEQNLILALSWSLCLYFFTSCFLLDAVSEKYSYTSLASLL